MVKPERRQMSGENRFSATSQANSLATQIRYRVFHAVTRKEAKMQKDPHFLFSRLVRQPLKLYPTRLTPCEDLISADGGTHGHVDSGDLLKYPVVNSTHPHFDARGYMALDAATFIFKRGFFRLANQIMRRETCHLFKS
ncbi:hypothetical protein EMPG_15411 [Blastomyces silverae]|uniref:Uncharacterized protein n=1 Tax=Blastomyces silverae TaxID=2060906 RepID=A0A0H1BCH1_9EURO|nr:hypothetical protein EMPG_15411 [Blastomyces silverae]